MPLTDAYLITSKNLESFFNTIQGAKVPEQFTYKFLENLDFTSSNDRLYVKLLKSLNFIDDSGKPLQRYYDYLDQTQSRAIIGKAIQEAYADLFAINKNANKLSREDVQNKLRTLTQGKKSDKVISLMAGTFEALCEYADWEGLTKLEKVEPESLPENKELEDTTEKKSGRHDDHRSVGNLAQLHYNIQIHLPESRDSKVYDAIFESLKRHLI